MKNSFSSYHPTVQAAYFFLVMLFTMFIMHPVMLVISLVSAFGYAVYLGRKRSIALFLKFILPMSVLVGILNPLFNHAGITILTYLPDGNPLTLESLIFGCVSGAMFSAVMLWCVCLNRIMSSDRVIYLFGRITPKSGLLISMILRFIPKLSSQFKKIRAAQKCIGRDITQGKMPTRIKNGVRMVSMLMQWALENSVDTADSLKSRGYGLPHRTSFSLFRFCLRDAVMLILISVFSAAVFVSLFAERLDFFYYPCISDIGNGFSDIAVYIIFLMLCIMPLTADIKEDRKWNALRSKL